MSTDLVVVDSRVSVDPAWIDAMPGQVDILVLSPERDGLDQVLEHLQGRTGIDALHVLSHGSAGALLLGDAVLDHGALARHAQQLAGIGAALGEQGDILLYGCSIADGDAGRQFIAALAQATGADVAASTDTTGTAPGANLVLEASTGTIEAGPLPSAAFGAGVTLPIYYRYFEVLPLPATVDDDVIVGGPDTDAIDGSGGDDLLVGGDEPDWLAGDQIRGGPGNDTLLGGAGWDLLEGGGGDDRLDGGPGDDRMYDHGGNDSLDGGDGDDYLSGGNGNTTLAGGSGDDQLSIWFGAAQTGEARIVQADGGNGDDLFNVFFADDAGTGDAVFATGGPGIDTFYGFGTSTSAGLTITDFAAGWGGDRINFDWLPGYIAARGEGGNPMAPALGYLRLVQDGTSTLLQFDPDGAAGNASTWWTAITLQDVDAAALTIDNFAGSFSPDGSEGSALTPQSGSDTTVGSPFHDHLVGGAWRDGIDGGAGDDWIEGGDEVVDGAWRSGDVIDGGDGTDTILGGAGNDTLYGGWGDDSLDGGTGDDELHADGGDDNLDGGPGDDTLSADGTGSTVATGGPGVDTVRFFYGFARSDLTVTDFAAGAGGDRIDFTWPLETSAFGFRGYAGGNPLNPGQGYLRLVQAGTDTLLQYDDDGAAGTQSTWQTVLTLQDVHALDLTADNFVGGFAPDGSDAPGLTLHASDGNDDAAAGGLYQSSSLMGSAFNDRITGGAQSDRIFGGSGADSIEGGDDEDTWWGDDLDGGRGDDTILGGAGDDHLDGGPGDDSLDGGPGDDRLYAQEGNDVISGGTGNDFFWLQADQPAGAQVIRADGGDGDDRFDVVSWSVQVGGLGGRVVVAGGPGVDTFALVSNIATNGLAITDFTAGPGGDRLDVTGLLDASSTMAHGYERGDPMSPAQGYLRLVQAGPDTLLQYDADGAAGTTDSWHTIVSLLQLSAKDITVDNFRPLGIDRAPAGDGSADTEGGADQAGQASVSIDLLAYSWNSHAGLSGVQVDSGSQQATTDDSGTARWVAVAGSSVDVTATRAVPQSEAADTARAVDLADAIAVLQMLNAQGAGNAPSLYQAFAADFNGDGRVEQQDAVDVLRHVVGLDAPAPQWLLLDAADPRLAGLEALQPGLAPSISLSPADADAKQVLVGVLRGDVDGSFAGPSGTDIGPIDPAGLAQPAMALPTDPAQFGVYI